MLRTWLIPRFGRRKLDEIRPRDIEALKAEMLCKAKRPRTINNALTVLGRMLRYAAEMEVIEAAPRFRFVKVPAQPFDFLAFEEYERLLAAGEREPLVRAAILCAGDAGLRSGEVRALKWSRVDLVAKKLTIAETFSRKSIGPPKANRIETIDMTDELHAALRAVRHLRGPFIFCNNDGGPWTRDWMDDALVRVSRRAGLRDVKWHALRHTFCSHLAMQNAPAKAVMELARHTSLSVTQRYMHMSEANRQAAIGLLNARPLGSPRAHGTEQIARDVAKSGG